MVVLVGLAVDRLFNTQLLIVGIKLFQIRRVAQYLVTAGLQLDHGALTDGLLSGCFQLVVQVLVEYLAAHGSHNRLLIRVNWQPVGCFSQAALARRVTLFELSQRIHIN